MQPIATELFLELLHMAKKLRGVREIISLPYLAGYRDALRAHLEEIKAGRNIAEVWTHQRAGAE